MLISYIRKLKPAFHQPEITYLRKFFINPSCLQPNGLAVPNY